MNYSSPTISQQLILMQLSDSFFPSGSYTLSHGLESLVQTERVRSPEELQSFLQILLRNKVGTTDLVASIHAYRGGKEQNIAAVKQADACLFAQTLIDLTRETQRKSGRALLMVASRMWQDRRLTILTRETTGGNFNCLHPVIFGVVGAIAGLNERDTMLAFLHSFLTSLLGAAIRLGAIGHLQAQQVLLQLAPDIKAVVESASAMSLDQMYSCTPTIDLAQMQHQNLSRRLFAS